MEPFPFDSENFDQCIIELYKAIFEAILGSLKKVYAKFIRNIKKVGTLFSFAKKQVKTS